MSASKLRGMFTIFLHVLYSSLPSGKGCRVTEVESLPLPMETRCGVSVCTRNARPASRTSSPAEVIPVDKKINGINNSSRKGQDNGKYLETILIVCNATKNILDKLADSYTIDYLNMLDKLKIKIIKLYLQNMLLPINILLI